MKEKKQLKSMDMNELWPQIYDLIYMYTQQFQRVSAHKT